MTLWPVPQPLINLEHSFSSNALDIEFQDFINILNERERTIFESRILPNSSELFTLQEIADRFGITREAIRLSELKLLTRIEELKQKFFSFGLDVAYQFRDAIGSLAPIADLPETLVAKLQLPTGRLVCFLAGGYIFTNNGLITKRGSDVNIRGLLNSTILESESSEAGIDETKNLVNNLIAAGVAAWVADSLVRSSPHIGHFDTKSFVIPESLNQKFKMYLRLTNLASTPEDSMPFLSKYGQVNERSLKNSIVTDHEISRVGPNLYGLTEWGLPEFKNLLKSMESFLSKNGPTDIADLCNQLHEKYGAKKNSISMYAQMHFRFVQENGVVRLREVDEPVVYGLSIKQENSCFRSREFWTWRVTVDQDITRGSGITIPMGLAAHLELLPEIAQNFNHRLGVCNFNWTGINPSISSLRLISESLNCSHGDFLFLTIDKSKKSISIDMRPGHSQELGAEENLRNYYCADQSESADQCAQRALGINLIGEPLWHNLSMRAENSSDHVLQLIAEQYLGSLT